MRVILNAIGCQQDSRRRRLGGLWHDLHQGPPRSVPEQYILILQWFLAFPVAEDGVRRHCAHVKGEVDVCPSEATGCSKLLCCTMLWRLRKFDDFRCPPQTLAIRFSAYPKREPRGVTWDTRFRSVLRGTSLFETPYALGEPSARRILDGFASAAGRCSETSRF